MDEEISAEQLRELRGSDADVRVVDIRSPSAFRRGHVPGSDNVPFGDLTDRIDDVADVDRVVTVCPHGEASVQAARLIRSYEGFEGHVASLSCGIDGWPYELAAVDGDVGGDGGPATPGDRGREPADARTADEGPDAPF
jgi:rhodanese-related sulfurtransferase